MKFSSGIDEEILKLSKNPYPRGVKKIQGKHDYYRIREGSYRLIYIINHEKTEIVLVKIGHRSEVYKNL